MTLDELIADLVKIREEQGNGSRNIFFYEERKYPLELSRVYIDKDGDTAIE